MDRVDWDPAFLPQGPNSRICLVKMRMSRVLFRAKLSMDAPYLLQAARIGSGVGSLPAPVLVRVQSQRAINWAGVGAGALPRYFAGGAPCRARECVLARRGRLQGLRQRAAHKARGGGHEPAVERKPTRWRAAAQCSGYDSVDVTQEQQVTSSRQPVLRRTRPPLVAPRARSPLPLAVAGEGLGPAS